MGAGEETVLMGGGKSTAWRPHKDDWFAGCLQCTEIIPLAAQLAWTWSMIPNECLQTGWCRGGRREGGKEMDCRWVNKIKEIEIR